MRKIYTRARADVSVFRIFETAGAIALIFGVRLVSHLLGVLKTSGWGKSARVHVRMFRCAFFMYLGNGWIDFAEIWCVVRRPLARRFEEV